MIGALAILEIRSTLIDEIQAFQIKDEWCSKIKERLTNLLEIEFQVEDEIMEY